MALRAENSSFHEAQVVELERLMNQWAGLGNSGGLPATSTVVTYGADGLEVLPLITSAQALAGLDLVGGARRRLSDGGEQKGMVLVWNETPTDAAAGWCYDIAPQSRYEE